MNITHYLNTNLLEIKASQQQSAQTKKRNWLSRWFRDKIN